MTAFRWTPHRTEAAVLVAADDLTNAQIAAKFGISTQALGKWIAHPEFKARVEQHRQVWRERVESRGIANRTRRIAAYNRRWEKLHQVIDERASDPDMQDVPGGTTGLLVHQTKAIGTGRSQTIIDEYAVDTATLKELRGIEKQAAEDLGQWVDKSEHKLDGTEAFMNALREFGRGSSDA